MKIEIEIGTAEQKEKITREMAILRSIARNLDVLEQIDRVIVAEDFSATVGGLTGDKEYEQNRGYHYVLAKMIPTGGRTTLVLSSALFTESMDTEIRTQLYAHELMHVDLATRFDLKRDTTESELIYSTNYRRLLEEYIAVRFSLEFCAQLFDEPSDRYEEYCRAGASDHIAALDDEAKWQQLSGLIGQFRLRMLSITDFQVAVGPLFDEISKSLVYAAAYLHSETGYISDTDIRAEGTRFVTASALKLITYLESMYSADTFDVIEGIDYVREFGKGLGFVYKDTEAGSYLRVVGLRH